MRDAPQLLTDRAAHHRDLREIAGQSIGVPIIVLAVAVLLSRRVVDRFALGGMTLTPAWVVASVSAFWYPMRSALWLGIAKCALLCRAQRRSGRGARHERRTLLT